MSEGRYEQLGELAAAFAGVQGDGLAALGRGARFVAGSATLRPETRLALLFTQLLSSEAVETLAKWFGAGASHSL